MSEGDILTSVVIPVLNGAATIGEQLAALATQEADHPWEVVIADNGSTDKSSEIARRWEQRLPQLRVVDASDRRGAGHARNLGAARATGRVLLFVDADDVVQPGWLAAWQRFALEGGRLGTGPIPAIDHLRTGGSTAEGPPVHLGHWPYASTSNMAIDCTLFHALGGFDATRFTGEDVDLSWRAIERGEHLSFKADAVVARRTSSSVLISLRRYYRYGLSDPDLYRVHRHQGIERPPIEAALRSWLGILARIPLLWSARHRERWAHQVGRRAGRVVGSLRARTLVL